MKSGVQIVDVSHELAQGMSGGPIMDARDLVVGIVHKGSPDEARQLAIATGVTRHGPRDDDGTPFAPPLRFHGMRILPRAQVPLVDDEICLVKGLLRHRKLLNMNQQRIIAYFSFPCRTVHHNVISAIARNTAGMSDADYPPADLAACRYFWRPGTASGVSIAGP